MHNMFPILHKGARHANTSAQPSKYYDALSHILYLGIMHNMLVIKVSEAVATFYSHVL